MVTQPVRLGGAVQLTKPVIVTPPADGKGVTEEPAPGTTTEKVVAGGTSLNIWNDNGEMVKTVSYGYPCMMACMRVVEMAPDTAETVALRRKLFMALVKTGMAIPARTIEIARTITISIIEKPELECRFKMGAPSLVSILSFGPPAIDPAFVLSARTVHPY